MIVVLHKTQVLCYPALLNIVLLIVFTLFTVPSSKALLVVCVNSHLYRCLVGLYVIYESDRADL